MSAKFATTNAKKVAESVQGDGGYRPKRGDNAIRILPPLETEVEQYGRDTPWVETYFHWVDSTPYACLKKMHQAPSCGLCRFINTLSDEKKRERIAARRQYWMRVHDFEQNTPVQVAKFGITIVKGIAKTIEEWGDITDPNDGRAIILTKDGEGDRTKYTVTVANKYAGALPKSVFRWFEENDVVPLEELVKYPTAKEIQAVVEELVETGWAYSDDDEGEEEEERSRKSASPSRSARPTNVTALPAKKRAPAAEEDEEDGEYEDDGDEAPGALDAQDPQGDDEEEDALPFVDPEDDTPVRSGYGSRPRGGSAQKVGAVTRRISSAGRRGY